MKTIDVKNVSHQNGNQLFLSTSRKRETIVQKEAFHTRFCLYSHLSYFAYEVKAYIKYFCAGLKLLLMSTHTITLFINNKKFKKQMKKLWIDLFEKLQIRLLFWTTTCF